MLPDVVLLISGREHLGLVDVVDADGLQNPGLDEVADADLCHDRDGHGLHNRLDHLGVRHSCDTAVGADVGGNAFEGHHRARARVLGDLGLLRGDDVHDDASLEHLRQPRLHGERACLSAVLSAVDSHAALPSLSIRRTRKALNQTQSRGDAMQEGRLGGRRATSSSYGRSGARHVPCRGWPTTPHTHNQSFCCARPLWWASTPSHPCANSRPQSGHMRGSVAGCPQQGQPSEHLFSPGIATLSPSVKPYSSSLASTSPTTDSHLVRRGLHGLRVAAPLELDDALLEVARTHHGAHRETEEVRVVELHARGLDAVVVQRLVACRFKLLRKASSPAAFTCSSSAFSAKRCTWKGAMGAGKITPLSSWFCSMAAASTRVTPMP